jgi:hypothetical protein
MSEPLSNLIAATNAVTQETQARFGPLTAQQLNWKPDASQWSIAQCFEHLVTANESYFPAFEQVLAGKKKTTLWERVPWLPTLWGKMLIKAVSPETTRKLKAPKIYRPASSSIDGAIIRQFIDRQEQVIRYMKASEGLDLEKIIMPSPVTNFITYSLMDAYRIIVAHEKRHLLQATRVLGMSSFPNGVTQ